jgi:hypothetical protein
LEAYLRLVRGAEEDEFLRQVALATGEVHEVDSVAADGHSVQFSADGRWAAYETGSSASTVTHIISAVDGGEVTRFPGRNFIFSPAGGRGAYLTIEEDEELRRVRAEIDELMAQRNRRAAFQLRGRAAMIEARLARVMVRDLRTQADNPLDLEGMVKTELAFSGDGNTIYFIGGRPEDPNEPPPLDVYAFSAFAATSLPLTSDGLPKSGLIALAGDAFLAFALGAGRVMVHDLNTGDMRSYDGTALTSAANGSAIAFLTRDGNVTTVNVVTPARSLEPVVVMRRDHPVRSPALSPDGRSVAVQVMPAHDWEIAVVRSDGTEERLLTSEIQHDRYARFLTNDVVMAAKGEGRHLRSYLYDIRTGEAVKLFHNNTVRTIAPEYEWAANADATKMLIVAERDGDTVSPERGVYLVHLDRVVGRQDLVVRLEANLGAERDLRARGAAMFAPVRDAVAALTESVSDARLSEYQSVLFGFDSKHVTQPGNLLAVEYLAETLRGFGYEPEYQWFEPRGARSANVVATLRGTEHPALVYVVSSHFDSNQRGPGADDNTSGTAILLEAARLFADHPLPATVKFAFFTGEEAGLLGSREFVRRAVRDGDLLVGALNNDMLGWANNHQLDNTIRYSNAGIRDLQHAAAFLFSDLITYDAKYYKSTDAAAYYEEYGDIVGGIGSYPVLGNPHYHQATDELSTINQDLMRETAKANIASIALLASSPSRLNGLTARRETGGRVAVQWSPSPEVGVNTYVVVYGPPHDPMRYTMRVAEPNVTIRAAAGITDVAVRAVNGLGLTGWDWARTAVADGR